MANVVQEGKRGKSLPRLQDGRTMASRRYSTDHGAPNLMYCVSVGKGFREDHAEYTMQFTEDEMIEIVTEWMLSMRRQRRDAAERKEKE